MPTRSVRSLRCCLYAALAFAGAAFGGPPPGAPPPGALSPDGAAEARPRFTADGKLRYPDDYREWIFLTSGFNMSYAEKADPDKSMFDNVFVNPEAYREFKRSGTWPERTLLVLESRAAAGKGSINKHGNFQSGAPMSVEVHVKDSARFSGGWAFFSFDGESPARQIPATETCYSCHREHAAVDTTFVQFYPSLLGIAAAKGTLAPGYRP